MPEAETEPPGNEIKIIYYIDDQETPYLTKLFGRPPSAKVTLNDLKNALGFKRFQNYRFFFKSVDDDIGEVKEEIAEQNAVLPCIGGKIVTWLVPTGDQNGRQCGESSSSSSGPGSIQSAPLHPKEQQHKGLNRSASAMISGGRHQARMNLQRDSIMDHSIINLEDSLDESADTDSTISPMTSKKEVHRTNNRRHQSGRKICDASVDSFCLYTDDDCTIDTEQDRYAVVPDKRRKRSRRINAYGAMERHHTALSSCTDSTMSLNLITVTLNLDKVNFLGVSILGQGNNGGRHGRCEYGNGGIYVGAVMKGGAVALDGRIEAGDMILQVNDISFENLSNEEAVRVLRNAVEKPGPIKLVVAKGWNPNPAGYFSLNRRLSVHPIDTSMWVAQTAAAMKKNRGNPSDGEQRSLSSTNSSTGKIYGANRFEFDGVASTSDLNLTVHTDMEAVTQAMAASDSGLDVRDRIWLKVRIPDAFLGCDLVNWLLTHVDGFADRRDAKKYASNMLHSGFIRATVNKANFSEQCYYVFGDICRDLSRLAVGDATDDATSLNDDSTLVSAEQNVPLRPINFPDTMFRRALPQIEAARDETLDVTANTSPPSTLADDTLVDRNNFHFPMTPTIVSEPETSRFPLYNDELSNEEGIGDLDSQPYHSTALNSPVRGQGGQGRFRK